MTKEQEKAKELVDKFIDYFPLMLDKGKINPAAKKCALIAVNEIIEVVESAYHKLGCGEIGELKDYIPYIFWEQVKKEIKKL